MQPSSSMNVSVCLSVCISVFLSVTPFMFPSWYHHNIFRSRGRKSRLQGSKPKLAISGSKFHFDFTYGDEMMHKAWCCLGEVPYWFLRSSVKFQGHTAKKMVDFDPNWVRVSSGQGKVREIPDLAKVREKSGNFVEGQGKKIISGKVREFAFSAI